MDALDEIEENWLSRRPVGLLNPRVNLVAVAVPIRKGGAGHVLTIEPRAHFVPGCRAAPVQAVRDALPGVVPYSIPRRGSAATRAALQRHQGWALCTAPSVLAISCSLEPWNNELRRDAAPPAVARPKRVAMKLF